MYAVDNKFVLWTPAGLLEFKRPPASDFANWGGMIGPGSVSTGLDLRESRSDIARADGEVIGASYWGNRSIVIDIMIPIAEPAIRGKAIDRIYRRLNSITNDDGILYWIEKDGSKWGEDLSIGEAEIGEDTVVQEGTPRRIPVRMQSLPTITHESGPVKNIQIVLNATQTWIESDFNPEIHEDTDFTGTSSVFELVSDAATSTPVSVTAFNYGSATVWPVISVAGPFTALTIGTSVGSLTYTNTVTTNGLTIDTRPNKRTIIGTISGNFNAYDKVSVPNWAAFTIPPATEDADDDNLYTGGTRQFSITSATGASSTTKLKVAWRWAWL